MIVFRLKCGTALLNMCEFLMVCLDTQPTQLCREETLKNQRIKIKHVPKDFCVLNKKMSIHDISLFCL